MARLSPETYKPMLQFRFQIQMSTLPDVVIYGHAATLPFVDNNPQTIEYGNTYMKVKGKTRWNDITITCYAFEGMTFEQLWNYLNKEHQVVDSGRDFYADKYKHDIQIQLLSPSNRSVVGTWKLVNAFFAQINFGQLDYGVDDLIKPELTIAYDYAEYSSKFISTTDSSGG